MRFCMVTTFYPPYHFGGDAIFVQALARALVARGHHVEVVHCEDAYRLRSREQAAVQAEQDGVEVHRLRSPFGMLSPLITQQTGWPGVKTTQLRAVLDRNFDVVNFHNISLIGGPGVLQMSRAPVTLYTLHEHWLLCPTHIFWIISWFVFGKIFKCKTLNPRSVWLYDRLFMSWIPRCERIWEPVLGQSLLAICTKPLKGSS